MSYLSQLRGPFRSSGKDVSARHFWEMVPPIAPAPERNVLNCHPKSQLLSRRPRGTLRTCEDSSRMLVRVDCTHEDITPWRFGFQCNERYLDWDSSAQRQLLKIVAAEKLGISSVELTARIQQLGTLIPDLANKLEIMKADLLVNLLSDPDELSQKLVILREALPNANISGLVGKFPYLVADNSPETIQIKLQNLAAALPGVDLPALLCKEPRLFNADIPSVLEDIKRLMGKDVDPVGVLISQPDMILTMEQTGLVSAIDIENPTESKE